MTVTMSEKHQVTIPSKIARALDLKKGSLFSVELLDRRIELIPVEIREKKFTKEQYRKLDKLRAQERGTEERVTPALIEKVRKGKL